MLLRGEVSRVAKGADCKSAASWLRRFESFLPHQLFFCQKLIRKAGKDAALRRRSGFLCQRSVNNTAAPITCTNYAEGVFQRKARRSGYSPSQRHAVTCTVRYGFKARPGYRLKTVPENGIYTFPSRPCGRIGERDLWNVLGTLLRSDVGRPDHFGPLLGLVGHELAEVGGRSWKHCAA